MLRKSVPVESVDLTLRAPAERIFIERLQRAGYSRGAALELMNSIDRILSAEKAGWIAESFGDADSSARYGKTIHYERLRAMLGGFSQDLKRVLDGWFVPVERISMLSEAQARDVLSSAGLQGPAKFVPIRLPPERKGRARSRIRLEDFPLPEYKPEYLSPFSASETRRSYWYRPFVPLPRINRREEAQEGPRGRVTEATDESFQRMIRGRTVVVDFWATWCGPCMGFKPHFAAESMRATSVGFISVDIDGATETARRYNIEKIPTTVIFRDGREIARHVGAMDAETFRRWLQENTR